MRIGRTAFYPPFLDSSLQDRTLYISEKGTLYGENWRTHRSNTFEDFVDTLFYHNGLCFVQSLAERESFPFLNAAIRDNRSEVLSDSTGHPLCIRCKRKSETRWIIPATSWERIIDESFLPDLRAIYSFYGLTRPTPGSLGQATIRRIFGYRRFYKKTACNFYTYDFLHRHGVGGRCDVFRVGETFPVLLELDMSSAYLAHCMWLPDGTSHWFNDGNVFPYITYFAECEVTIHQELALGPFPVRTGRKDGKIVYPTLPGRYKAYLWREQIEDTRMAGCTVNVKSGVGWRYLTNCLTDWARYMYRSRVYLDGSSIERDSKKIAVSGLGHFGQSHTFYRMTDKDEPGLPNAITDDGRPMLHYVVPYTDYKRPAMLHWFNYFIMQTARTLYKYALPYAIEGRLVMTNYDALLIVERNERERFARKHSIESLMIDMGDLRWQELTNVKILGERSLKCDQKVIRPGVETVSVDI